MVHLLVEVLGGLAVALGAFVTLASLPMAAVLLVAMFTVHLPYGFGSIKIKAVTAAGAQFGPPGYEVDLLYLACLAALVFGGPGPLAIDVPQYGGFCANGVKNNRLVDADPTVFFIVKGELYVCESRAAEKEFRANEDEDIVTANRNWHQLNH